MAGDAVNESWEMLYFQDAKIGYGHTLTRPIERDGKQLVEVGILNQLEVSRFGQASKQVFKCRSVETPEGQVLDFATETSLGPTPTTAKGRVEGNEMIIEVRSSGAAQTQRLPWSSDIRGFYGVEQSLEGKPMAPGETRSLKVLMAVLNEVADVELSAKDLETTSVLGAKTQLLRIENVSRMANGNELSSTLWTDPQGRTIKNSVESLQQVSYRTTRRGALAKPSGKHKFDLGIDLIVKPDKPLPHPRETRKAVYRVDLDSGDPLKAFTTGPTQTVRALGPHAAEVTVSRLDPEHLPASSSVPPEAAPEYLTANIMLQIDDPRIRAMAREGSAGAKDPVATALALERYVYKAIKKKDFSQAFASAAEVAKSREGDCSEHAVLLAALARACDIPSRVAMGLVYVEGAGGFGYHMWTELYLSGVWVPFDAVSGRGGTSAAYLKLTDSSLDGSSAYSSFLSLAQVLGQLKIALVSAN